MAKQLSVKYTFSRDRLCLNFFGFNPSTSWLKNAAEIVGIGETSTKIWKVEKNHAEANMFAVKDAMEESIQKICSYSNNI